MNQRLDFVCGYVRRFSKGCKICQNKSPYCGKKNQNHHIWGFALKHKSGQLFKESSLFLNELAIFPVENRVLLEKKRVFFSKILGRDLKYSRRRFIYGA